MFSGACRFRDQSGGSDEAERGVSRGHSSAALETRPFATAAPAGNPARPRGQRRPRRTQEGRVLRVRVLGHVRSVGRPAGGARGWVPLRGPRV